MVFSSMTFLLLFLPIVLLLYFSAGSLRRKNAVLLLASLLFYAWGEPVCVLAMLFTTAVNYFCAAAIVRTEDPRRRKTALTLGVGVSLALLFYFKYFSFALQNLAALFSLELAVPQIRLPIGISFYTFQVLTYTVDVYRGKAGAQKSFPKLLLYVSCFPQLIAGPIVQYADVAAQLDERKTSVTDFSEGIERFVVGLAKKVLLANVCGAAVEALPGGASSLGGAKGPYRLFETGFHTGRRALIISDSYAFAMAYYLFPFYDDILQTDLRHANYDVPGVGASIRQYMRQYEIDDIYLVTCHWTSLNGPVFSWRLEEYLDSVPQVD